MAKKSGTDNSGSVTPEIGMRLLEWARTLEEHHLPLHLWEEREGYEPSVWQSE